MTIFSKELLNKAIQNTSCSHQATNSGGDGKYTIFYHQHNDGVIIINSYKEANEYSNVHYAGTMRYEQ